MISFLKYAFPFCDLVVSVPLSKRRGRSKRTCGFNLNEIERGIFVTLGNDIVTVVNLLIQLLPSYAWYELPSAPFLSWLAKRTTPWFLIYAFRDVEFKNFPDFFVIFLLDFR